jgi:hypothetical protein
MVAAYCVAIRAMKASIDTAMRWCFLLEREVPLSTRCSPAPGSRAG